MQTFILSAIGEDRPGLVSSLATAVDEHGGHWVDSQLALLAGQFAGVVVVEIPAERADAFLDALPALAREVGLQVEARPAESTGDASDTAAPRTGSGTAWSLHLLGQDRPGMVREVATALTTRGATIETLHSRRREAPEGGGMLFEAEAALRLDAADEPAVREALEAIAADLMVDIDLQDA